MSETVLDVNRRELGGGRVSVRVIQDGEMFRFEPADFSDDTDASLAELLSRSGTLLQVGAHNCLHVKTKSGPAWAAVHGSLQVVDVPEVMDPTAWSSSDKHAAEHAEEDEEWGWADEPGVLTRWLEVDNESLVVRLAAGHPIVVAPDGELRVPEPLISVSQSSEGLSMMSGSSQLNLGRLPDGQLISVVSGDESYIEALAPGKSVADWLGDNILDTRFALQVFNTDLTDQDVEILMEASAGFGVRTRFSIYMPHEDSAAIIDSLCAHDESLASLRMAVQEAESEPGLRLRELLRRCGDDSNAAYEELKEWFGFIV